MQQDANGISRKHTIWVMAALVALGSLLFFIPTAKDWRAQSKAEASAASKLIDPSSAQFRNVHVVRWSVGRTVCGEINGKNAFGAYVGFTRFAASYKGEAFIDPGWSGETDNAFAELRQLTWSAVSDECKW